LSNAPTAPASELRASLTLADDDLLARALLLSLVGSCVIVLAGRREQSALANLARRRENFHETWTRDLAKRIRMTTGGAVFVAVWSIGFLFYSVLGPFGLVEQLVVLSAAFILGFGALHTFFVDVALA
jgi:hypothetical protein